jgi:hypothetical protein
VRDSRRNPSAGIQLPYARKLLEIQVYLPIIALTRTPNGQPGVAATSDSESYSVLTVGYKRNEMIRRVLRKVIDKFEREWNYDAGCMRDIIDANSRAAW